jgi:hypothetical protein
MMVFKDNVEKCQNEKHQKKLIGNTEKISELSSFLVKEKKIPVSPVRIYSHNLFMNRK